MIGLLAWQLEWALWAMLLICAEPWSQYEGMMNDIQARQLPVSCMGILRAAGPDYRDMEIDISRTPANATITGGPSRSSASPSVVTFSFVPQVNSSVGAPIASAQCLIQDTANQAQVSALWRVWCDAWRPFHAACLTSDAKGKAVVADRCVTVPKLTRGSALCRHQRWAGLEVGLTQPAMSMYCWRA